MNTEYILVATIKAGVLNESFLFTGPLAAERKFIEMVNKLIAETGHDAREDDIEASLDDGYYEVGNQSVCITWPVLQENFIEIE